MATITGGAGDELLSGSAESDLIRGAEGADTLLAGEGEDTLDGGAGRDRAVLDRRPTRRRSRPSCSRPGRSGGWPARCSPGSRISPALGSKHTKPLRNDLAVLRLAWHERVRAARAGEAPGRDSRRVGEGPSARSSSYTRTSPASTP